MACGVRGCSVSIHAPAWGATPNLHSPRRRPLGFQSTHPRGVRRYSPRPAAALPSSFNPRTRVGCDDAPSPQGPHESSFNPRTRVGCDRACVKSCCAARRFQSTHPRGVRRRRGRPTPSSNACFNPRTRVGATWPCWRATFAGRGCFNPRTRVGCDAGNFGITPSDKGFNPRTRVGCDHEQ